MESVAKSALQSAWNRQSAESSLERWRELAAKERWDYSRETLICLVQLFGASWYFTRYIFYRGQDAITLIERAATENFSAAAMRERINRIKQASDLEQQLEQLRLVKNEIMLQILSCYLQQLLPQQEMERMLTNLSEITLDTLMEIFGLESHTPKQSISVLGMGRLAGYEMTFGSDLDLIFLYQSESVDSMTELGRRIRLLLRNLSSASAAGQLYEIDMRLRPHGTSGALLTSVEMFLEYHQAEREIWERQMMTRCRPVFDDSGIGEKTLAGINEYIYGVYDEDSLRREIVAMRKRVQDEKGSVTGKFDVKRGMGGLMDIDFLVHYLQLRHGRGHPPLRSCSTRIALQAAAEAGFVDADTAATLLEGYDFLKRVETSLRLFDMKSISSFNREPEAHESLARAMGFYDSSQPALFLERYFSTRDRVRASFMEVVGDPG